MAQIPIDELEAGVDRILAAYGTLKVENLQLREQLAAMKRRQDQFAERLDSLLARLDGVELL